MAEPGLKFVFSNRGKSRRLTQLRGESAATLAVEAKLCYFLACFRLLKQFLHRIRHFDEFFEDLKFERLSILSLKMIQLTFLYYLDESRDTSAAENNH